MKTRLSILNKTLGFLLSLLLVISTTTAQENYHRAYDYGGATFTQAIEPTSSLDFVTTGWVSPPGSNVGQMTLTSLNNSYDHLWTKRYGSPTIPDQTILKALDVKEFGVASTTLPSGYAVCGEMTSNTGSIHPFIMVTDAMGNPACMTELQLEGSLKSILPIGGGLTPDDIEGFVACGHFIEPNTGNRSALLVRTDKCGIPIWWTTVISPGFSSTGNDQLEDEYNQVIRGHDPNTYHVVGTCNIEDDPCARRGDVLLTTFEIDNTTTTPSIFGVAYGRTIDVWQNEEAYVVEHGESISLNVQNTLAIGGHTIYTKADPATTNCDVLSQDLLLLNLGSPTSLNFAREYNLQDRDFTDEISFDGNNIGWTGTSDSHGFMMVTDFVGNTVNNVNIITGGPIVTALRSITYNPTVGRFVAIGIGAALTTYGNAYLVEKNPLQVDDCNDYIIDPNIIGVNLEVVDVQIQQYESPYNEHQIIAQEIPVDDEVLCDGVSPLPCSLDDYSIANISACNDNGTPFDSTDDFYTADITLYYNNPPATGTLELAGDATASTGLYGSTTHTFTGVVLPANGATANIIAYFSDDTSCSLTFTLSAVASCSTGTTCGIPTNITVNVISGNIVKLNWTAVVGASYYKVRYRTTPGGSWITVSTPINARFLINLIPNTAYQIQVKTVCATSASVWSPSLYITTGPNACFSPTTSSVTYVSSTIATINWTPTPGDVKYKIKYKPVGGSWTTTPTFTPPTYTLTGLIPGHDYLFKIKTKCSGGWAPWSPLFTMTMPPFAPDVNSRLTNKEISINVYPNPVVDELSIDLDASTTNRISIYNTNGKAVRTIDAINSTTRINVSDLPAGIYLIKISTSTKEIITKKFVKQ